ncbi:MAG: lysophospholipid acyltransferase family protein [Pikeienuella sp.]
MIRSFIFLIWTYGMMAIVGICGIPFAIWSRDGAYAVMRTYVHITFWGMRHIVGLSFEVRGEPPTGEVLITAKHQSFFDVMAIFISVKRAKFIMKRSLVWAPFLGFYALRIGVSPVTRGKGKTSVNEMMAGVSKERADTSQLIIYPQGTRVPPGEDRPYKRGAHAIYSNYPTPCVPVAVNTGIFWPRVGVRRKPGVAVIEFLPPIEPGLDAATFMDRMKNAIEPASDALAEEAYQEYGR